MELAGKKVTVVGLGKSGFAAVKFLLEKKAHVRVTDSSSHEEVLERARELSGMGAEAETGRHTEEFLAGSQLFVVSPGVPKESLPFLFAKKHKIPVLSEIELAFHFCPGRIIAVTGSNGKTTTCHLIHRVLRAAGRKSVLCGNVGTSFLEVLNEVDRFTWVVLELSSFQLEDCRAFRPKVAVVLNISPNHLDRHRTLRKYIQAKEKIFANQKKDDCLILNHGDRRVRAMAKKARARIIFFNRNDQRFHLNISNFKLKGPHNLENIMACAAVADVVKIPNNILQKTMDAFVTLEHRLEPIGEINGVQFVNDAKSTTVDSTKAAILSIDAPVILVAGGRDKGAPFGELESLLLQRVKKAVLYGEARERISGSWKSFRRCRTEPLFRDAVRLAFSEAQPGDCLLLSPMCTSFDQFSSYEERGRVFKKIFEELAS